MEIRVLGTHPDELSHRYLLTSILLNGELSLDAGALGLGLTPDEQRRVGGIILTHTHLDHLASLPLFLLNRTGNGEPPPTLFSTPHNVAMLKKHLFNNVLWPDLLRISHNFLQLRDAEPLVPFEAGRFSAWLFPVNHPVPTYGVVVRDRVQHEEILFTGDSTICETVWTEANRCQHLRALVVDVAFPNDMKEQALSTGHLTPGLLADGLEKLRRPAPVFAVHYRPAHASQIAEELAAIRSHHVRMLKVGETVEV